MLARGARGGEDDHYAVLAFQLRWAEHPRTYIRRVLRSGRIAGGCNFEGEHDRVWMLGPFARMEDARSFAYWASRERDLRDMPDEQLAEVNLLLSELQRSLPPEMESRIRARAERELRLRLRAIVKTKYRLAGAGDMRIYLRSRAL